MSAAVAPTPLAVADRSMRRRAATAVPWRWDGAMFMLGHARLVRDPCGARAAYVATYLRHHCGTARVLMPDHCPSAMVAVAARPWISDSLFFAAIEPVLAFLRHEPRNRFGGLDHLGSTTWLSRLLPRSMWIDSLMMYAATAVAVGRSIGDDALVDFGLAQPSIFADRLQDRTHKLFHHAYLHRCDTTVPVAPCFWLRGNAWVAAALVDMLAPHPEAAPECCTLFAELARALRKSQQADHLWPTLLGKDAATEASGSALVAYALAKGARCGLLPAAARADAQAAFDALCSTIVTSRHGASLPGISGPTIPGPGWAYRLVPRFRDVSYGVGALCMLAAELT